MGYRDFVLSKWFGLGENECYLLGIGLLLFVFRVRVETGTDLGGLRFLLFLYIENMDREIRSCPKVWLA